VPVGALTDSPSTTCRWSLPPITLGSSNGLIAALGAGFGVVGWSMSNPHRQFASNPLSGNGLGALTSISTASVQAWNASVQASNASVQASTASDQASSGTDKASGRPLDASSETDRAPFVAFELPSNPFWSRFASVQASTASVEASSASVETRRAAAVAAIAPPEGSDLGILLVRRAIL
jgi:hypothetical protein